MRLIWNFKSPLAKKLNIVFYYLLKVTFFRKIHYLITRNEKNIRIPLLVAFSKPGVHYTNKYKENRKQVNNKFHKI